MGCFGTLLKQRSVTELWVSASRGPPVIGDRVVYYMLIGSGSSGAYEVDACDLAQALKELKTGGLG